MTLADFLDMLGIKGSVVVAGLSGGLLRALSHKRFRPREMIASPVCGALAAAYLTLPAVHYVRASGFPLPPPETGDATTLAAAFLIGTCAMWIADALFEVVARKFSLSR
jgi:hypothetical protein